MGSRYGGIGRHEGLSDAFNSTLVIFVIIAIFKCKYNMSKRKWTDEQFICAVKNNFSYAGVLREIGLKVAGSNYDTVKRKIAELKLDVSHMTGKAWNCGVRYRPLRKH